MILPLVCLVLAGCDDRIHVNSDTVVTKGLVVEKIYVAPKYCGVVNLESTDNSNIYAVSQTKELYLIILENAVQNNACNCVDRFRTVYSVTSSTFSEIEAGKEFDVSTNPNIVPVRTRVCAQTSRVSN